MNNKTQYFPYLLDIAVTIKVARTWMECLKPGYSRYRHARHFVILPRFMFIHPKLQEQLINKHFVRCAYYNKMVMVIDS